MTRRRGVPRWSSLLLIGLSAAGLLIPAILPNDRVDAAQKPSLGWLVTTVVDRNGRPVDAIVVIQGAQNRAGRTGGQGRHVVAVPPGRYLVSAILAGQATPSRRVTVLAGRTRQITIVLGVSGPPASPAAAQQKSPATSPAGMPTSQVTGGTGQTSGASAPSISANSGSAQAPGTSGSGATAQSTEPTDSTSSAAVNSALAGSSGNTHSQGSRPAKIKALKANPNVTQPGGTSTINADLSNPDNLVLTYSWQASGGIISGTDLQVLWAAPQSTGQFTVSLTVKDIKGRTSSGTVTVYAQAVTAPAKIAGQVTDTLGAALVGASVSGTGPQAWSATTDASGNYLSPDLAPGSYSVTASLTGYTASTSTADAVSGSAVVVNFALTTAAPTGTRNPATWPFDTYSPWNYPIGTGAVYNTISGNANLSNVNIYFDGGANAPAFAIVTNSDPIRSVRVYGDAAMPYIDPNQSNFFTNVPRPVTYSFRIPDNAAPQAIGDMVMYVFDPDGVTVHECYMCSKDTDGINWKAYALYQYNMRLDGYGKSPYGKGFADGDKRGKHTAKASGLQGIGGAVRKGEFLNGIPHALVAGVTNSWLNRYGPGGYSFVWPASSSDSVTNYGTTGNLYMGSLLAIPASVNLDSLTWNTVQGKNVGKAMQRYGIYIVDTNGSPGVFIMGTAQDADLPWQGDQANPSPFTRDLRQAATLLKVVSNNGSKSVGGGGTPIAPLAPPLTQVGGLHWNARGALASSPYHIPHTAVPLAAAAVPALLPLAHRRDRTRRTGR